MPCQASPIALKLGGGLAITSPFGTFYSPNISPDPADGIGRWTEAEFVSAVLKGTVAFGRALFSGLSLCLLRACPGRRHPRPLCLPEDAGAGVRQGQRITTCRFRSTSGAISESGSCCSWTASLFSRIPRVRRSGIAAPISSTALAIAPNATARAIFSAASSRRSALPAARTRKARAGCRTSRKSGLANGAPRTSPTSSRPARRLTATPPADRWRA